MTGFSREEFDRQVEHGETTGRAELDEQVADRRRRGVPDHLPEPQARHLEERDLPVSVVACDRCDHGTVRDSNGSEWRCAFCGGSGRRRSA